MYSKYKFGAASMKSVTQVVIVRVQRVLFFIYHTKHHILVMKTATSLSSLSVAHALTSKLSLLLCKTDIMFKDSNYYQLIPQK